MVQHLKKKMNAIEQINRMKGEKKPHMIISTDAKKNV